MLQLEDIVALAGMHLMLHHLVRVLTMLDVECVDTRALWCVNVTELGHLATVAPRVIDRIFKLTLSLVITID